MISLFLPEGKIGKYRRLPSPNYTGDRVLHLVYESSPHNKQMQSDAAKAAPLIWALWSIAHQ